MGAAVAKHGLDLVYGGGNVGLMGVVADAALAAYMQDLAQVHRTANDLAASQPGPTIRYLGKDWAVNTPLVGPWFTNPDVLREWAKAAAKRPELY